MTHSVSFVAVKLTFKTKVIKIGYYRPIIQHQQVKIRFQFMKRMTESMNMKL